MKTALELGAKHSSAAESATRIHLGLSWMERKGFLGHPAHPCQLPPPTPLPSLGEMACAKNTNRSRKQSDIFNNICAEQGKNVPIVKLKNDCQYK